MDDKHWFCEKRGIIGFAPDSELANFFLKVFRKDVKLTFKYNNFKGYLSKFPEVGLSININIDNQAVISKLN